jgi:hypothetical protein
MVAALLIMIGAGAANGLWNDRWQVSNELDVMTKRLPQVPMNIGDWVGEDTSKPEFTERLIRGGYLHAMLSRSYRNQNTGERIAVLMATGRPGPISTHNPLTCIGGGDGMQTLSHVQPTSLEVGGKNVVFSHCDFARTEPVASNGLRVYWSWHDRDKGWIATSDPRLEFASYRALTKIYVTRSLPAGILGQAPAPAGEGDEDAVVQFIKECLPTIDEALFK